MSSTYNYIPHSESERVIWFGNFNLKLPLYASLVGITASEVTAIQKDNAMYQYITNMLEAYKQTVNNITAYRNLLRQAVDQQHLGAIPLPPNLATTPALVPEGVFDRISKLVKRIKASVNYTDAMGQDLGIIAATQTIDVLSMRPDLKINMDAGRPHIKCSKGYADAMDLYVDRKDGNGFTLIGRLLKLDYIDIATLPTGTVLTEWDYKAMYVIGNDKVGLMSSVVSVVVKKL